MRFGGRSARWSLLPIATTGPRFGDFGPYAASVNAAGVVAFQATLVDGRTGVYVGDGGGPSAVVEAGARGLRAVTSHPAIDACGRVAFFGETDRGEPALYFGGPDGVEAVVRAPAHVAAIGPLGPTMNEAGSVAFRADTGQGRAGVFHWRAGRVDRLAEAEGGGGFEGLPVVNEAGAVVFRTRRADGGAAIHVWRDAAVTMAVETGPVFATLGRFPDVNTHGAIVFAGSLTGGGSGIYVVSDGRLETIVASADGSVAFRGALINDAGRVVYFGTPRGGALAIYGGPDPVDDRVVGLGDALFGSVVSDLALNPVSYNGAGQLAIRLAFTDGHQRIVRASPT